VKNFLVLIHSAFTGDVVRQVVVNAESGDDAIHKIADKVDAGEHAIAIPTGSEPDFTPEVTATSSEADAAESVNEPAVATPDSEGTATPEDAKSMILQELEALPHDLLARILSAVKGV
jgi:hypothetical protein